MLLVKLSANKSSFRTVEFNAEGLSLIIGKRSDPEDHSLAHSINGVGKSLVLYLINFCLGSTPNKELTEKLPSWEFTLQFKINDNNHVVTRSTAQQKSIDFDGKKIKLTEFNEWMGYALFALPPKKKVKFLTYRALISQFFRQGKSGYIDYDRTSANERIYGRQIRTAYLLGLNKAMVDKKRELREEGERLKDIKKQFKKDSLLREYYHGERNATIELAELKELIDTLEKQARDYKVSSNYESMEKEAEEVRRKWRNARNRLHGLESSLKQIGKSVSEQPDLSASQVNEMYNLVNITLPDLVSNKLNEVTAFHQELIEARNKRLAEQRYEVDGRISELKFEIAELEAKKDDYYKYLGTHGALIEYETLRDRLTELKKRSSRLTDFQELAENFEERSQKNELEFSLENVKTTDYLKSIKSLIEEHHLRYRTVAKRIWPNSTSGLDIKNNTGQNSLRFDIEPRIQSESSDGVGESKIFCFDMTILLGSKSHSMKTLMHDNRLYPGIDPRQRAELFRIAHDETISNSCQYIASMNEDNLTAMKDEMSPHEFDSLFSRNTILELTDASDAGKLLGISVDLDYGK